MKIKKARYQRVFHLFFGFLGGIFLGLTCLLVGFLLGWEIIFFNKIPPNTYLDSRNFGGLPKETLSAYLGQRNLQINNKQLIFISEFATHSAVLDDFTRGLNVSTTIDHAFLSGRQGNFWQNQIFKFQSLTKPTIINPVYDINEYALYREMATVAKEIDLEPEDALFQFRNGRVSAFRQAKIGRHLNQERTLALFAQKLPDFLVSQEKTLIIDLPIEPLSPKVTTEAASGLGIKELLATGVSYFYDSIPERLFNIELGAQRTNGVIIAPGEIFSFNQAIGTISAQTGYRKGYSIVEGKTVLDDGGGVCQVSTTLFRAVLNAGLPVVERAAHAYRVGFYEQGGFLPGMDATVYPPSPDFRFLNDTLHHLLLQNYFDTVNKKLSFEIYGASDGRQTTISPVTIYDIVPAPSEPVYQDDPNLPKSYQKQIDWPHAGAKAKFTRTVKRGEEILISEEFKSDYRLWPALVLRGTKE